MLEQKKAVIFDLDGTLADSMWVWTSIDSDYIEKYHLTIQPNFYKEMEGKSFTETAEYFLQCFPEIPYSVEEVKGEWNKMALEKYCNQVPLKKGARTFLETLKEKGILAGIATSNSRELVTAFLESQKITSFFSSIRTSCEVGAGKPAPDVYRKVMEDLGVTPQDCLVFEDVPMGILAGKNAGMKVCAIEDAFSETQREKKRELADYYINDYTDVLNGTYEVL